LTRAGLPGSTAPKQHAGRGQQAKGAPHLAASSSSSSSSPAAASSSAATIARTASSSSTSSTLGAPPSGAGAARWASIGAAAARRVSATGSDSETFAEGEGVAWVLAFTEEGIKVIEDTRRLRDIVDRNAKGLGNAFVGMTRKEWKRA
jgi:hypothetical protein